MQSGEPYIAPFIRRVMPNASEAELVEAAANLKAYLRVLYQLFLDQEAANLHPDSAATADHDRFGEQA